MLYLSLISLCCVTSFFARLHVLAQVSENYSPIYPVNKTLIEVTINDNLYGTRNVSYFVTSNGLAVIDGDVVYGSIQDLTAHTIKNSSAGNIQARSFSASNIWPNTVINYKYDSDATASKIGPIVSTAIQRWLAGAPYLTFNAIFPNSPAATDGVVTITASDCDGCQASIGFVSSGSLFMNLQQACPSSPGYCSADEATHEFGHVLGLQHEHQRPDREQYVHFNCANLEPSCSSGVVMPAGATCCSSVAGCCAHISDFGVLTSPAFDFSGPYDINSTMEYRADAFAISGTDTLTSAKPGIVVPLNNIGLPSSLDFERVCKLYRAQCPRAQACAAAFCPVTCVHVPVCDGAPFCLTGPPQLCCIGRELNAQCEAKQIKCANLGCDFLLS